jgi:hypothetical protein
VSDSEDIFLAERKRRKRLALVLGALVLVPVGFFVVSDVRLMLARDAARLTDAQRAELAGLLEARQRQASARVEQWNAALGLSTDLKTSAEPCPVPLPAPSPVAAASYVKFGTRLSAFGDWALCLLRPEQPDACVQTWQASEEDATLRARLEAGDVFTWDLDAARQAKPVAEPPRVLVRVEAETPFKLREAVVGQLSYNPGALAGRAYLFLPAEGRFVCGATVAAQSSKNVETEFDDLGKPSQERREEEARAALRRDLEVRVRLALDGAWEKLLPSE